jgi:DNA-binding transcriptional MocR family regulator
VIHLKNIFSKRAENIKSSEIREILKLTSQSGIISFAGGLPSSACFPVNQLAEISVQVMNEMGKEALQYNTTDGFKPLRQQIASRMLLDGSKVTESSILITCGSQQGLDFSGKIFLDPGDIVLCESPSYLGAINAFKTYGAKFVEVETDQHGMVVSDLDSKLKFYEKARFIYVIPNFQNPTGRTWSLERRVKVLELAKKHNKIIIEDNPYGELRYEGAVVPSIFSLDTDELVVYLGTFSKTFCPGMRIGWVAASEKILEKYTLVKQSADLHSNSVAQRQLSLFLNQYDFNEHIRTLVDLYKVKRDVMLDAIEAFFPKEVKYSKPEGGLFLWVELPEKINTREMFIKAIEAGVAYVPGDAFFPNSNQSNAMRLNFSNVSVDEIRLGMKTLGKLIENYK